MFIGGAAFDVPDPEQAVETKARIAPQVSSADVFLIRNSPWEKMLSSVLPESEETLRARNILQLLESRKSLQARRAARGL